MTPEYEFAKNGKSRVVTYLKTYNYIMGVNPIKIRSSQNPSTKFGGFKGNRDHR
jgi:hypothetical protein